MGVTRGRQALARGAAVLGLLLLVATTGVVAHVDARLGQLGRSDLVQLAGAGYLFVVAQASATVVGAFLLIRRPEHPVGWCLTALGASVALSGACQSYGLLGLVAEPERDHPGAGSAAVLASSLFVLWLVLVALICYLTPTGLPLSRRWDRCARIMWLAALVWLPTIWVSPGPLQAPFDGVINPWAIASLGNVAAPLRAVAATVNNVLVLASFVSLFLRFRRSVGEERRQLLWMGIAVVPVPVLLTATFIAARTDNDAVLNVAAGGFIAVLPLSVGLAVAKTRLYDVDRILSAAASYAVVSALLASAYAAVVLLLGPDLGGVVGSSTAAVAAGTLLVAVLARPAYRAVQDGIDRRFSRRRFDALRVVRAHVVSPDPDVSIEQVLRDALSAPDLSVAYWVQQRRAWVTGAGRPAPVMSKAMTVERGGRPVARVSTDAPVAAALAASVLKVAEPELESAGLRAAVALQLEEVRSSRERLVSAQLDERRRVERDLHDGAQQRLLAMAAQLQAALLNGSPERMREALGTGVEQSRVAVQELRELANGLHPSALADGGLAAALRELAARHHITICVDEEGRRYPPRIEATAWFIACEAVTNAVKHAAAKNIHVVVDRQGDDLSIAIHDDGIGGADAQGSGLRGISDRAEAVGGRLLVQDGTHAGTTVQAVLPCAS